MKIALIGYGKMGQAIEKIALERGHEISLKISIDNLDDFNETNLVGTDVAIEFTTPDSCLANLAKLCDNSLPIVCGTTAWHHHLDEVKSKVEKTNGALIYATNFSLGVNLFFLINEYAARLFSKYNQYKASITEIHHTAKLDAPSGTAITIAEGIIDNHAQYQSWSAHHEEANSIPITSKRIDPAPGTHIVDYKSEVDTITMSHEAHSRQGFALGAVIAAEWIVGKKGVYTMRDLF